MRLTTIYEDDYLLVVDKPPGWVVNDATTVKDTPTVQNYIAKNYNFDIAQSFDFRSGIVHRLDKETSGVLLLAKDEDTFRAIQSQFKQRTTIKSYLALAHGRIDPKTGTINAAVARLPWRRDRFGVLFGGREAVTSYEVQDYYKHANDTLSYVKLKPATGRTHQIRIHLKHIGNPIVADTFYAGRKTARKDRTWCARLFLHAHELEIMHPKEEKRIKFTSLLAQDLQNVLTQLAKFSQKT